MAKLLVLEKDQYLNGKIPLRRGDNWTLRAKVVNRIQNTELPVNLTGAAATGFFKAANSTDPDEVIAVGGTIATGDQGAISFAIDDSITDTIALSEEGISFYATINDGSSLYTVETTDNPLEIKDRGFVEI